MLFELSILEETSTTVPFTSLEARMMGHNERTCVLIHCLDLL